MTISTAQVAHEHLIAIASRGNAYRWNQVFTPGGIPEPDPTRIVGKGFDFTHAIQVPDNVDGTVDGTVELRVLALEDDEALFLRARLSWQSSTGGEHKSSACYTLTPASAEQLSNTPVEEEPGRNIEDLPGLFEAIFEAVEEAAGYKADWEQTYPGSDFDWYNDEDENESMAAAVAHDYHVRVVHAANEAEPDLLCMLSDSELGAVHPDEIGKILAWVERQPEISQS